MKELRELFKYGSWANLQLVDHCAVLNPDDLERSIEGTFGSIKATFLHMLEQEMWGLAVLKASIQPLDDSSLPAIRSSFVRNADLWQDVFNRFEELNSVPLPPPEHWNSTIPQFPLMYALQTAHHQELHRTHIRATLKGIDAPLPEEDSTDVWAYWKDRTRD